MTFVVDVHLSSYDNVVRHGYHSISSDVIVRRLATAADADEKNNGRHKDGCHDNLGAEVGPECIVAEERTVLITASDVLVFAVERYSY